MDEKINILSSSYYSVKEPINCRIENPAGAVAKCQGRSSCAFQLADELVLDRKMSQTPSPTVCSYPWYGYSASKVILSMTYECVGLYKYETMRQSKTLFARCWWMRPPSSFDIVCPRLTSTFECIIKVYATANLEYTTNHWKLYLLIIMFSQKYYHFKWHLKSHWFIYKIIKHLLSHYLSFTASCCSCSDDASITYCSFFRWSIFLCDLIVIVYQITRKSSLN